MPIKTGSIYRFSPVDRNTEILWYCLQLDTKAIDPSKEIVVVTSIHTNTSAPLAPKVVFYTSLATGNHDFLSMDMFTTTFTQVEKQHG